MSGILYLCGTPIGNMEDITYRCVRILKEVDLVAAEDTRHSLILLKAYDINTPLTSYHEFNKYDKGRDLTEQLKAGKNIALITDAGMPGISDPGYELVQMAIEENIQITVVPGPSACVSGLILSGIDPRCFFFRGFLPAKAKEREEAILAIEKIQATLILYEAPHRLKRTLEDLERVLGSERKACLARELTKKFEEAQRGTLGELARIYREREPKGEFVIIIEGNKDILKEQREKWSKIPIADHLRLYIDKGLEKKEAIKQVATDRGVSKREIYNEVVKS